MNPIDKRKARKKEEERPWKLREIQDYHNQFQMMLYFLGIFTGIMFTFMCLWLGVIPWPLVPEPESPQEVIQSDAPAPTLTPGQSKSFSDE
jgi:hypothetical protein